MGSHNSKKKKLVEINHLHLHPIEDNHEHQHNSSSLNIQIKKVSLEKEKEWINKCRNNLKIELQDLDTENCEFNTLDSLSTLPMEIRCKIINNLSFMDILNLQIVNRLYYSTIKSDLIWKQLILRDIDIWLNKDLARKLYLKYEFSNWIRWRRFYFEFIRKRVCLNCNNVFSESNNANKPCQIHPQIRDIVHDNGSYPSGVYYLCCMAKPKDQIGCQKINHLISKEELDDDYIAMMLFL
ncbi:hypothetical protein DLAC_08199 [Tieghemostelium lacteum]|uniref:F-box domain-containing protein n=1 Tax=Tieghemostelium lacteum TaxID=361077 RepID=A0A151ZBF4_TIELA|nr:hypothetical protein DLAC_08199 [Tieghemostelium lacteum]|eukprot:KYQ91265.1 hypothetical protein DLAC_08199 [Tieghemostelium lacteum]